MKSILVPFDGSDMAIWALNKAIEVGKPDSAKIYVYHAIKHNIRTARPALFPFLSADTNFSFGLTPDTEQEIYNSQKQLAERILQEAKKILEASSLDYEIKLVENLGPVDGAKDLVDAYNIDLVIVGARGIHGTLERVFLGSVSSSIVNEVCTDVMVVRTSCTA